MSGPQVTGASGLGVPATSFTALVQPRYPGQRDAMVFPPSCDMLPTAQAYGAVARVQCQDYKKGVMVFWKQEACVAMPFEAGNKVCRDEREVLRKLGDENAAKMRKDDPGWWKTPYLNTYAYGDIRLRTEELGLTARIWGGGTYWGWRDDEIFMSHATGVRAIPSHSFVKAGDLAGFQDALLKQEGIVVTGPQDLQKPEYVRVKTDLAYLKEHSNEYRKIAGAETKDLDGKTVATNRCDSPMAPPRSECTPAYTIYMDATVPAFRDHLIAWYEAQVDAGADGVHIDDTGGLDPDEALGDDTVRRFAAWLVKERPASAAQYGVTAAFSYRAFLAQRGYTKASLRDAVSLASEDWRKVPLMVEFRAFYNAERERALTDIVTAVRRYALEKGRPDFVVTGNVGELAPSGAFLVGLFDFFSFEHDYLGPGKDPLAGFSSVVPIARMGAAKERPVTNEQVMGEAAEAQRYAKVAEPLRSDLVRLQIMDGSAVHSGTHYIRYETFPFVMQTTNEDRVYVALEDRTDLAGIKTTFGFIQRYRDTYRDVAQSPAKVAIVYDNDEVAREWREEMKADHQGAVVETAKALWAKNVEFDVVSWKQLAAGSYSVAFVPPSASLAQDRVAQAAALRSKGAKVYSLWRTPPGLVVDGLVNGGPAAEAAAQAAPPLALPAGMRSIRYVDGKGATIVHLMNYEFDANGSKVKKDVRIDPAFLGGATNVTFASLEHPDPVTLDPKDPRIPQLTTYGLLIAKK